MLIVDEPTRGIDVGAKAEVHKLLVDMARSGIAVIAISSELPEILAISDRIVTMREGRVTGEIVRAEADRGKADAADDDARHAPRGMRKDRTMSARRQQTPPPTRPASTSFGFSARFAPLIFLVVLMAVFALPSRASSRRSTCST